MDKKCKLLILSHIHCPMMGDVPICNSLIIYHETALCTDNRLEAKEVAFKISINQTYVL